MTQRWIMHVDMDAFYAAIEQRDRPQLRGLPVIVGGNPEGRGVVATCSYEARRFGVRSAMPMVEARRLCSQGVYLRPDMPRYGRESRRLLGLLMGVSPLVEQVSIDEAYVDISGLERLFGSPREIGERVKRSIKEALGLSASVGIGPNRLIAKLASDHRKPDGVTLVRAEQVAEFLAPLPVARLRGVGGRAAALLDGLGISTVAQLRACSPSLLEQHLGRSGALALVRQAQGLASDRVGVGAERKSLSRETTFEIDVRDPRRLRGTLLELASDLGRRLRRENLAGRLVTLKLRFDDFETHTRQQRLSTPTQSDREIYRSARLLLEQAWVPQRPVRLLGLGLSDWAVADSGQLDLFAEQGSAAREARLLRTLDRVAERFGGGKLSLGMPCSETR